MTEPITSFTGEYRFLSNFWRSPFKWRDREWPTVEHAYQAAKARLPDHFEYIAIAPTPGQAKRRGRLMLKEFMHSDWDEIRLDIMRELVTAKFKQNRPLMKQLKATGDAELVEGNTWGDTYWGKCNGRGQNHLGKILMEIRDGKPC